MYSGVDDLLAFFMCALFMLSVNFVLGFSFVKFCFDNLGCGQQNCLLFVCCTL